jgi:hypothetical protein
MKILIPAALISAIALSGCQSTSDSAKLALEVGAQIAAANKPEIAKVAARVGVRPCDTFKTAAGYFTTLSPVIPQPYNAIGSAAVAAGNVACNSGDIAALDAAWVQLQGATKAK